MARYTGPVCRMCRADGRKLMLKGQRCMSDKCPMNKKRGAPGKDPKQRLGKRSEYSLQLIEKQKIKRMYGLLEKQFHLAYEKATRMPGVTGENFNQLLERRLDNVVYRMHFAVSRSQARQLVLHGHILVNGKAVDIASYEVKAGDVIEVKENIVKDIIPEYVDNIECEGGKQYCLSLFLLSSDYAVFVVATKELMDILIEE